MLALVIMLVIRASIALARARLEELTGRGWDRTSAWGCFNAWTKANLEQWQATEKAEKAERQAKEAAQPSGLTASKTMGEGERRRFSSGCRISSRRRWQPRRWARLPARPSCAVSACRCPTRIGDGSIGVVRLWARWEKQRDGAAKLLGFDVRCGKERSGDRMLELRIRAHDGALVGYARPHARAPGRAIPAAARRGSRRPDCRPAGRAGAQRRHRGASTPLAAAVAGCSPILCRSKPASVPSAARLSTRCFWRGGGRHDSGLPRERGCWNADQT